MGIDDPNDQEILIEYTAPGDSIQKDVVMEATEAMYTATYTTPVRSKSPDFVTIEVVDKTTEKTIVWKSLVQPFVNSSPPQCDTLKQVHWGNAYRWVQFVAAKI